MNEKTAPVQGWPAGIPWSLHLEAYAAYSKRYDPQPALIEGECRGGFSVGELDEFIPGWRDKASEIASLRSELDALRKDAERYRWLRDADMDHRNTVEHYASDALDAAIDAAIDAAMKAAP